MMKRPYAKGFTLVEVIVSLAVLSMILLALVASMRMLADTQERLNERVEATQRFQAVSGFLTDVVRHALPLASHAEDNSDMLLFEGAEEQLTLVAPVRSAGQVSGLQVVRFQLDGTGRLLVLFSVFPDVEEVRWDELEQHVLLDGVEARFAYRAEAGGEWLDIWDSDELPELVRLRVKLDRSQWPDLLIRPLHFSKGGS
ncbi:prepilin-type N-terminal cleavage/methylation domain-containing protein [Marinobacterium marinum]|uniref:Prepilin-type N-terminal cleavage/methylation domain-containing protein n=1 Tax=Marinobacterium marinum TaxID=2756129 RepID=A0A7W1WVP6_9GAMM|nr:prepilin-type N-terminal cleavage/methylation domain-containing protein [Marinobacterium marinum]MBA4501008.1 prepilin-type N-terminal cleavage/methylation domain-containing protein [Marinobacterium marinum]